MRPILSWYRVRRLRTGGVSATPDGVQQLLERTAERFRLRQAVRVLQSTLVETSVVVGYFRPVILLPMSAVTGLSPGQLDAILAHELAHIRRHDYLVNLLQTLVETVFFYHPAIWWLSNQVRCERENCCDDIAAAVLGNRVEYGRALLALEECRASETALAVGAQGGSLLARVRRLLGRVPPGRAFSGASIAAIGLLAAVAIAIGVWAANGLGEADAEALAKEPDQVKKEGADDPDDKEIARLVKQLGSSDFRTRQAATKRLEVLGEQARAALHKAVTSGADLETQRRASALLQLLNAKICFEGHTANILAVAISP